MAVSSDAVAYLRGIPAVTELQEKRLEYFMPFLENSDDLVAIDAWAEFGNSSYDDIVAVRHIMSPENLRVWISDAQMSPERLGLYGMMLGLCGTAEDSFLLLQEMTTSSDDATASNGKGHQFRFGAEGLMAGYLMLTGEQGLQHLEETFIIPNNAPDSASLAFAQSLQFMMSYESDIIESARICESMRLLLQNNSMREIAITNLSRWEDWETLAVLTTMFEGDASEDRSTQRAILQFAEACVRKGNAESPPSQFVEDAEAFLSHVQSVRPELLTPNLREFQAPQ